MEPDVVFCGRVVSESGTRPADRNLNGIRDAPTPKKATELKSFLGMINFYHMDLRNLPTLLEPLHMLPRKNVHWKWGPKQEWAFGESRSWRLRLWSRRRNLAYHGWRFRKAASLHILYASTGLSVITPRLTRKHWRWFMELRSTISIYRGVMWPSILTISHWLAFLGKIRRFQLPHHQECRDGLWY